MHSCMILVNDACSTGPQELLRALETSPQYSCIKGAVLVFMPGFSHIQELFDLLSTATGRHKITFFAKRGFCMLKRITPYCEVQMLITVGGTSKKTVYPSAKLYCLKAIYKNRKTGNNPVLYRQMLVSHKSFRQCDKIFAMYFLMV